MNPRALVCVGASVCLSMTELSVSRALICSLLSAILSYLCFHNVFRTSALPPWREKCVCVSVFSFFFVRMATAKGSHPCQAFEHLTLR